MHDTTQLERRFEQAGLAPPACPTDLCLTNKLTIVGITNLTADRYHVADGDTVTFTAAMTPVNAFEKVWWDWYMGLNGPASGQTYQRQMSRWGASANGVVAVTATCGTKTLGVDITVYQLAGATVSSPLVAAGEALTFTAQLDPPGGSPPPLQWYADGVWQGITATGTTFTPANLPPGYYSVSARLGDSLYYYSESYAGATVVGIGSVTLSGPDTVGAITPNGTLFGCG